MLGTSSMKSDRILFLVKFFEREEYADAFLQGKLYLNRLSFFKKYEETASFAEGRKDIREAITSWHQPKDVKRITIIPKWRKSIVLTSKDIASPVMTGHDGFDDVHLYCMYAVKADNIEFDGERLIFDSPEDLKRVEKQIKIDERNFSFGEFAIVVINPQLFCDQVKNTVESEGYFFGCSIIQYYDKATFSGYFQPQDVLYRKEAAYSYQNEFRICINTKTLGETPLILDVGDLSAFSVKIRSSIINNALVIA